MLPTQATKQRSFGVISRNDGVVNQARTLWRRSSVWARIVCVMILGYAIVRFGAAVPKLVDRPHEYIGAENLRVLVMGEKYTVRLNTYKRPRYLRRLLQRLDGCAEIEEVQVVWSELDASPPDNPMEAYGMRNVPVRVERHETNSITNRFRPVLDISTEAVLSIDDDLLPTCAQLRFAFSVWRDNRATMVGYHPRNIDGDRYCAHDECAYLHGYHLVLTKMSFQHKRFLAQFASPALQPVHEHIDAQLNCEDIAMAFVVSDDSAGETLPLWVDAGAIEEQWEWYSLSRGIHSKKGLRTHEQIRSECVTIFRQHFQRPALTKKSFVKHASVEQAYHARYGS